MPEITKITGQQRNAGRVSIFVGNAYAFSLTVDQLLHEKLHVGQQLSAGEVNRLKKLSTDGKLYESVIRKLSRRQHSQYEIEQFCKKKQATEEATQTIIQKLNELQYLDDTQFAQQWVSERTQLKHRSKRALQGELRQKGISSEIIDTVLSDLQDTEVLTKLIKKKQNQRQYANEQKLIAYLQRKGFNYDEIRSALNSIED